MEGRTLRLEQTLGRFGFFFKRRAGARQFDVRLDRVVGFERLGDEAAQALMADHPFDRLGGDPAVVDVQQTDRRGIEVDQPAVGVHRQHAFDHARERRLQFVGAVLQVGDGLFVLTDSILVHAAKAPQDHQGGEHRQ